MSDTAAIPFMARCGACKTPARIEIPGEIADRFGPRLREAIYIAMRRAGISTRCAQPGCAGSLAAKQLKVTYKAERACGGTCWSARGDNCVCSCEGSNHGAQHTRENGLATAPSPAAKG